MQVWRFAPKAGKQRPNSSKLGQFGLSGSCFQHPKSVGAFLKIWQPPAYIMSFLVRRWIIGSFAVVSLATHAGERTEWRDQMQSIVPRGYMCQFATNGIKVD